MSSDNLKQFVTKVKTTKASYEWKFENFFLSNKTFGEGFNSPSFKIDNVDQLNWLLQVYPCGYNEDSKDFISVFLKPASKNVNKKIEFDFSIINSNKKKVQTKHLSYHFKDNMGYGLWKFIEIKFLKSNKETLLPDNTLTLCCDIEASSSNETFEVDTCDESKYFKFEACKEHMHTCQDLGILLEKQELTDILLKTCDKELKAHKTILAARSPVFLAMFSNNTIEKIQSEVKIIDFNSETVSEMLEFMYTGNVKNIEKNVVDLLGIAEKYQIMRLKSLCENFLCCSVTIENAIDLLVLTDRYNSENVKTKMIKFILSHKKEIIKTPEFIDFKSKYSQLIADLFCFEC